MLRHGNRNRAFTDGLLHDYMAAAPPDLLKPMLRKQLTDLIA